MHILLVEDQAKIAENIREFLEFHGYATTVIHDGKDGYEAAMMQDFDVVILDVNLPRMDGYDICTSLREAKKNVPILMLTARAKQQEVVHGLNIGADDYLVKPFDLQELLARVRALLRRHAEERSPILSSGSVTLDSAKREVRKGKTVIDLSPKEFGLLEFLLLNKGRVQERPRILEHVWGGRDDLLFSQTVDVHVAYLRRKLGKHLIETVPGKGYVIPAE